jgi:hypothetical protein
VPDRNAGDKPEKNDSGGCRSQNQMKSLKQHENTYPWIGTGTRICAGRDTV